MNIPLCFSKSNISIKSSQGVPVLILANKQDLRGAREPKQIEKLLGLHELSPMFPQQPHPNIAANCASSNPASLPKGHHSTPSTGGGGGGLPTSGADHSATTPTSGHTTTTTNTSSSTQHTTTPTSSSAASATSNHHSQQQPFKGWYIQPACAITGEGLQEGLEALYEMIIKKRKMNKAHRKKR